MSNHFSADYLKSPGDDRRLDITDVFLFKSSKDPDKMILIVNSNPTAPRGCCVPAAGTGVWVRLTARLLPAPLTLGLGWLCP